MGDNMLKKYVLENLQRIVEKNKNFPGYAAWDEAVVLLDNLKVSEKKKVIMTQVINELLEQVLDKGTHEQAQLLVNMVIAHHTYALFSSHWVKYFTNKYSPLYKPKSKWPTPALIDTAELPDSLIIKALKQGWHDIVYQLLPMFHKMCKNSRAYHIPEFIQAQYLEGIQWYYSNFKDLTTQYHIKGKILMDAINLGNWDIFLEVINHENYKEVSHGVAFPDQGYPSAWAMRANRMDMLKYMVENNDRLQVLYEKIESCDIHPLCEAAKLEDQQQCKTFFPYLLEHYLSIIPDHVYSVYLPDGQLKEITKSGINHSIIMCAAVDLVNRNHMDMLKYLIEDKHYDFHDNDELLFCYACRSGNEPMMQYLYDLGANIHGGNDRSLWWTLDYSLEGILFLEKNGMPTDKMLSEIMGTIITRNVPEEIFDYFLNRANPEELSQALEKAHQQDMERNVYLDKGLFLKNKSKVRNYMLSLKFNDLPFSPQQQEAQTIVSKI
jgi:ankyrin repeat protein